MLVLAMGVREAARKLGISEDTVSAWSARGKWLKRPELPPLPPTMQPVAVSAGQSIASNPADILAETLADDERETKLGLSRLVRRSVQAAQSVPVESAADALSLGKLASVVHKWGDDKRSVQVQVNLGFFGG